MDLEPEEFRNRDRLSHIRRNGTGLDVVELGLLNDSRRGSGIPWPREAPSATIVVE
jgi:hypothetical protein